MTDMNAFVTPEEVSRQLGISVKTVYRLVRAGTLSGVRVGRSIRIGTDSLRRYLVANAIWTMEKGGNKNGT